MQIPNMQYNQTWPRVANTYATAPTTSPQIIGEGDVVSNVSPDGNVQYFFMPISQWLPYTVPNYTTVKSDYNPNVVSWLVRSISYPSPLQVFGHPHQRSLFVPLTHNSDFNMINTGFQIKFHNDNWTSTTDLYYFFPGSRQSDWSPMRYKGSAGVQVEMPTFTNTVCHCQVVCNKPCYCPTNIFEKECKMEAQSCMSVDPERRNCGTNHRQSDKHCRNNCIVVRQSNGTQISCDCEKNPKTPGTSDKLVTTFADQETACTPDTGRETQTIFNNNSCTAKSRKEKRPKSKNIQPEVWHPNKSFGKKLIKAGSSQTLTGKSTSESCECSSESV